jgi:signal transduction histidine kinase
MGALHLCLIEEFNYFSSAHGQSALEALAFANKQLVVLIHDAIDESTSQYVRLEKESASGRVRDLERALTELGNLEKQPAELIHQAVHDLGGNVQAVTSAATDLTGAMLPESEREQLGGVVKRVLELQVFGPNSLPVHGDSEKVHRIAQNLILNAIKYTVSGHVTVRWGTEEGNKWWFIVKDTGPGITSGSAAPMLAALVEATETADDASASASGSACVDHEISPSDTNKPLAFSSRDSGEGIGLSIVKRLCELIDAILEVKASPEDGTTFRVELPTRYDRRSP